MANDNLITSIDVSSLKKLKRLAILNLANNNINNVPAELGNLTNIRYIYGYYVNRNIVIIKIN